MMKKTLTTLMVAFCYTLFAQPCDSDLIGHYTFDDQTAIDSSSYVNDGTPFKVSPTVDRFGNPNEAYLFDGDSSYIALPNNMLDKQAMTISMWFKTTAGGTGVLMGQQNTPIYQSGLANWTPILYVRQDGQLHASFWNGSNNNENDSTFLVNDDMWHHVVITGDASSQDVYIDNVLCGTGTGIQVLSNVIYNYIGNAPTGSFWPSTPSGYFSFDGAIDDVRIYDRMLNAFEISDLHNETGAYFAEQLNGAYSFNNQTANDESGNSNDGTPFKVSPTVDRFGNTNKAYLFDGDSSYIALPNNMLDKQAMTISMWFKTTAGGTGVLMGQQNTPIYQSGLANWTPILYVRQDGQLHASFWNGSNSNENDSTFFVNDDMWHHVVITGDAGRQDVYIDNVLCGTGTGIQVLSNVIYNYIGNAPTGSFWPSTPSGYFSFDGTIDDVRIYNRKLCPLAVNKLYNASNPTITGIIPVKKELSFSIFPNPTNNLLNIECQDVIEQVKIFSLDGRIIKTTIESTIPVYDLAKGTYVVQIITSKGIGNKLFIKQ